MGNELVNEGKSPDFSGLLNGLLSNPSALSMLSSLLGNLQKPNEAPSCHEEKREPPCDPCPKAPPLLPPVPPPKPRDDRADLLCSLRPYLSKERCDMLDALLKILELMALFRRRR